jgi:hypothetical protein
MERKNPSPPPFAGQAITYCATIALARNRPCPVGDRPPGGCTLIMAVVTLRGSSGPTQGPSRSVGMANTDVRLATALALGLTPPGEAVAAGPPPTKHSRGMLSPATGTCRGGCRRDRPGGCLRTLTGAKGACPLAAVWTGDGRIGMRLSAPGFSRQGINLPRQS